jgi:hypothetical protein
MLGVFPLVFSVLSYTFLFLCKRVLVIHWQKMGQKMKPPFVDSNSQ